MAGLSYEEEKELTRKLLDQVRGHWDKYLPIALPEMADAVEAWRANPKLHVDCILPGHGGKDDMRCKETRDSRFVDTGAVICTCTSKNPVNSGLDLIQRVRGCDFKTARDMLLDALGGRTRFDSVDYKPPPKPKGPSKAELEKKKAAATKTKKQIIKLWNEVIPVTIPDARPARLWFKRRHVWQDMEGVQDLGFHPAVPYYDDEFNHVGDFPALIAMVRGVRGDSRTLHRTWISALGEKAPVDKPRKLHAVPNDLSASGGALQLDPPGVHLNLAEGIETALAARLFTGYQPTWATLTKDLLRMIELPECVKAVTVWADKDRSDGGQEAAAELVMALRDRGISAVAMLPPVDIPEDQKSVDWNDMLANWGLKAIRENHLFYQWQRQLSRILEHHGESLPRGSSVAIKKDRELAAK